MTESFQRKKKSLNPFLEPLAPFKIYFLLKLFLEIIGEVRASKIYICTEMLISLCITLHKYTHYK